jgi:phosphoribosylamine--glycine ligase
MRVLVIDQDRIGLDFVLRAVADGHEVRWYRFLKKPTRDGEGFAGFKIVDSWQEHMSWAKDGLIVCTHNGKYIHELDRYREFGYKIFGPTVKSAALEIRRAYGMDTMIACGIDVPKYNEFQSLQDAYKFSRKTDDVWVFKTLGDNEDKALSFVPSNPEELCGWIEGKIRDGLNLKGPCLLQEKIDMVAEMGVSGWFGPEGFLPEKWQIFFEHKRLMNDELGCQTGEMGCLTQYEEEEKLAEDVLIPMVPVLTALGHRGDFAVGCGIDSKGKAWPFEPTARLGWPSYFLQIASHRGDCVKWMRDLLDGKDSLRVSYDPAIAVLMAQPPFPYDESEVIEPIVGINEIGDHAHLVSIMKDGDKYKTTGEYVLVVTGQGKTIEKTRDRVYGFVDKIKFPDRMYRTDIGCKVASKVEKLQSFGYALNLE